MQPQKSVASAEPPFVRVHKEVSAHAHTLALLPLSSPVLLESGVSGSIFSALVGTLYCQRAPNPHRFAAEEERLCR